MSSLLLFFFLFFFILSISSIVLKIQVFDSETLQPVPMVNFTTTSGMSYMTDNFGMIHYNEYEYFPESPTPVWFEIKSDGYTFEKSIFGFVGIALPLNISTLIQLPIQRSNLAQRLYRYTGNCLYCHTIANQYKVPNLTPSQVMQFGILNSIKALGQDSVMNCVYKNQLYWFFGDSLRTSFPLGNFQVTGAITSLNLDLEVSMPLLQYFDSYGFAKQMAPIEPLEQPTWIHDVVNVIDDISGEEKMMATFYKPELNGFTIQRGLLLWNDSMKQFQKVASIDPKINNVFPVDGGHSLYENGYYYFGQPFLNVRIKGKSVSSYLNLAQYEAYSPLKPGTSNLDLQNIQLDRDESGKLIYGWKVNTSALQVKDYVELIKLGKLENEECIYYITNVEDKLEFIYAHAGTVNWNNYRKKYISIFTQAFGKTSFLGEVWYSESEKLEGPFTKAKKIVSHNSYTYYNPRHHALFDKQNGRQIFFEGTYTTTYDKAQPTPQFNYNQIMYSLDLSLMDKYFS